MSLQRSVMLGTLQFDVVTLNIGLDIDFIALCPTAILHYFSHTVMSGIFIAIANHVVITQLSVRLQISLLRTAIVYPSICWILVALLISKFNGRYYSSVSGSSLLSDLRYA